MRRREVISFEEHGEVLAHWYRSGWREETVVVLDRHLDLKRIHPRQLSRVREAARSGSLDALNRDLPFRDDERFPYGLDNFLYAAADVGLIRRVVWVLPEERPLDARQLGAALWNALSLLPGHGHQVAATFRAGAASARATVGPLVIEATTLRRLRGLDLVGARLDVDLDYFYNGGERPVHSLTDVVTAVSALGLLDEPPTMTYSIYSGFMPDSFRPLGEALSRAMGFAFVPSSPRGRHAERSMEVIAGGSPLSDDALDALTREELLPLGGPGMALRALLCARAGRLADAEESHAQAQALGDRATWPAYELGLKFLARQQHGAAAAWLARAEGELVDTIQAHGLALRALAECKRQNFEECLALTARCLEELPLRREPYQLAEIAASRLGRQREAAHARDRLAWLTTTYEEAFL